jgi:hypothetical protein
MGCPKCGSDEWKSASFVHKSGITSTSSRSFGGGVSVDGDLGVGGFGSSGENQTELSKLTAPPEPEKGGPSEGSVGFGCSVFIIAPLILYWLYKSYAHVPGDELSAWPLVVLVLVVVFALIALGVLSTEKPDAERDARNKRAADLYEKTRVCMRCGEIYVGKSEGKDKSQDTHDSPG